MIAKLAFRRYAPSDAEAVGELFRASDAATGAQHRMDADKLRLVLGASVINQSEDTFVIEREGQMIGFAYCEFVLSGHSYAEAVVHPDYWKQGIGTELLRLTEARTLERGQAELPPDLPILLDRGVAETNHAAIRLFEADGYQFIRSFNQMRITFDQPINPPPLPDGLTLRPFDPADARAVAEANEESFADHWEHEHRTFEEWTRQVLHRPGQDPSLWLIAYDGDQVAGVCLNRPFGEDDPQLAWVWTLGVRRGWRKQGLGFALLMHSFARFQARGFSRAGLNVDASSPTKAGAIYQRAGMHVYKRVVVYRKVLRGTLPDEVAEH